ncbi:MAG: toxin-antitoxin system TumE family protein [Devosia sp.]
MANTKAILVLKDKQILPDGYIREIRIWELPAPVPGSTHRYKYRLFFGSRGRRLIGYDNERGKGDHRHHDGEELPYVFVGLATLMADFAREIDEWRSR